MLDERAKIRKTLFDEVARGGGVPALWMFCGTSLSNPCRLIVSKYKIMEMSKKCLIGIMHLK